MKTITEEQKKEICELAGVQYEKRCNHYKKNTCVGDYDCVRLDCDETEIDFNILMKAVFQYNKWNSRKYDIVIDYDGVYIYDVTACNHFYPIERYQFDFYQTPEGSLTEALIYVIEESK